MGECVDFGETFADLWMRNTKGNRVQAEGPLVRPQAHTPCPGWGLARRLRRGSRACSPMGRPHFSFGGERKVCKRKPAARRLREKAFYCPFLKEGVRNVARNFVGELPPTFARAPVLPFFRRQNGRAFFPSLPNAALLPRSWHRADSNSGAWELQRSLAASQRRETDLIFSFTVGARHA